MNYVGGKFRLVKYILPIMLKYHEPGMCWVEPFVGGGNVIASVPNDIVRIGADINPNTIDALLSIRDYLNELPKNNKEFTEDDFNKVRNGWDYKHKNYIRYTCGFGGLWKGVWSKDERYGGIDFVRRGYDSAQKQSKQLQGVELITCDYRDLEIPPNSLIYCDPPYKGTSDAYKVGDFDHNIFWEWCRSQSNAGHTIFISELNAPSDFLCIWQRERNTNIVAKITNCSVEKLFVPRQQLSAFDLIISETLYKEE